MKEGDKYSRYESYDEGTTWYKTSAGDMTNQLKRTVYGCLDLEDNLIDFSYTRFNYDSSSNTYKYKANENIAVKFEFINGSIDKIIITRYRTSYETTFVRTITFGNADVDVPTTNVIDATVSE